MREGGIHQENPLIQKMPSLNKEAFYKDVYSVVKEIPSGKVISYGEIARFIGWPQHSRMVGKVMSAIPKELKLPCHRVVNSLGKMAPHWPEQKELLLLEGVLFRKNGCVNMKCCIWDWEAYEEKKKEM